MVAAWPLLVADFASEYRIRLADADLGWREFVRLLTGLLAADTRLYRMVTAPKGEKGAGDV